MLKKILILVPALILFSCQSNSVNKSDSAIQGQKQEPKEQYETIADQDQAEDLNKQTEEQIEEVEVKDRVFFGYDQSTLSDEAKEIINVQTMWLKSDPSISIIVEGHCDERGTREYNIALGERRATSVKNYMVKNGIDASRIKTVSYGKERPAFFGNNEKIFSKNRRAVAVIATN